MNMKTEPPRGMRDLLPAEVELRDRATATIVDAYRRYGFGRIEAPALESLALLTGGGGGENEKLIYRVLKRGEKLERAKEAVADADQPDESGLADLGLRFDLTVPLSRYYANNASRLPNPLKAIQVGPVWRAERPARGRYRQFTQCDIDTIGVASELAEAELLTATAEALLALGLSGFEVQLNDRRILLALAASCGFDPARFDGVFIAMDKLEKIGRDGVRQELQEGGYDPAAVARLLEVLGQLRSGAGESRIADLRRLLPGMVGEQVYTGLQRVADAVGSQAQGRYRVRLEPTLVRGMSYYTGQVFEIRYREYPFSIAGGGRYDGMIGRLLGRDVPACGCSIGFERVILILQEEQREARPNGRRIALLVEGTADLSAVLSAAERLRGQAQSVSVQLRRPSKKQRKQLEELAAQGFTAFCLFDPATAELPVRELM